MNTKSWFLAAAAIGTAAALLAACGGGGNDTYENVSTKVPASASQSVGGWISYIQALIAYPGADALTPVDVSNVTPPTDETSSPTPVD